MTKATATIFAIVVLDLIGAGILFPILPFYVREYRTDALTVGLMALAFSAAQFLAGPVLGVLSDRYGRRPVLLASIFGSAVGYVLFGIGGSLTILFLARILDGFTGGNISTAQSYLADVTPPAERAKAFGLIGAAWGIGFVLGPIMAGVLSRWGLAGPAYGAAAFSMLTFIAATFFLPESLATEKRKAGGFAWSELNPFTPIAWGFRHPRVNLLLVAAFVFNFPFTGLMTNFSLFTHDRFGLGPQENALLFTALGLMIAILQGFVIRRAIPNFGRGVHADIGMVLMVGGFLVVAFAPHWYWMFAANGLLAIGSALVGPTLTAMLSRGVTEQEQGTAMGVSQAVASLTRIFGPVWAGLLYDHVGRGAPYWAGAVWFVAALFIMRAAVRRLDDGVLRSG
ncbi:MAG: MFS transporter [Bryobacteraceae bacterium]